MTPTYELIDDYPRLLLRFGPQLSDHHNPTGLWPLAAAPALMAAGSALMAAGPALMPGRPVPPVSGA